MATTVTIGQVPINTTYSLVTGTTSTENAYGLGVSFNF